jgi:hypothetical protein
MTWREIYADQNLRMAGMLLKQQGDHLNDAQARVKFLEHQVAEVRRVLKSHVGCEDNCSLGSDLEEVLGDE